MSTNQINFEVDSKLQSQFLPEPALWKKALYCLPAVGAIALTHERNKFIRNYFDSHKFCFLVEDWKNFFKLERKSLLAAIPYDFAGICISVSLLFFVSFGMVVGLSIVPLLDIFYCLNNSKKSEESLTNLESKQTAPA